MGGFAASTIRRYERQARSPLSPPGTPLSVQEYPVGQIPPRREFPHTERDGEDDCAWEHCQVESDEDHGRLLMGH